MRVIENYKPIGELDLPKKSGSKSFVTRRTARAIKKLERQNSKGKR